MRFRRCRIGEVKRRYKFCKDHDTVIIYFRGRAFVLPVFFGNTAGGQSLSLAIRQPAPFAQGSYKWGLALPLFAQGSYKWGLALPLFAQGSHRWGGCGGGTPLHVSPFGKGRCRAKRDGGDKRDKNLADGSSAKYFREKGEKIFLSGTGGRKKLFRTFKKAGGGVHINCKSGAASQRCGALQRKTTGNKE